MNEAPKRGRPRKHLADEHHFKAESEFVSIQENLQETADAGGIVLKTPDNDAAAVATPAVSEAGQAGVSDSLAESPAHAAPSVEDVASNPTVQSAEPILPSASTVSEELLFPPDSIQESPIEEKIHALVEQEKEEKPQVELNGWHSIEKDCHTANKPPLNGMPVRLSEKTDEEGIIAFWKKTRAFANTTKKWEISGIWCNFNTGLPVRFEPKYWKERYVS